MGDDAKRRILIVEDERVVAKDLQRMLLDLGYDVPHTAASSVDAIRLASELLPDIVLMDIRIQGAPDGIETARLLNEKLRIPVVFLTAHTDTATIARAKLVKPLGFLTKPVDEDEVRSNIEIAIYKLTSDGPAAGPEPKSGTELASFDPALLGPLSVREREVLAFIARGYRVFQIAERLTLSPHTVRNHIKSIFIKLNIHSQAELLELAHRNSFPGAS